MNSNDPNNRDDDVHDITADITATPAQLAVLDETIDRAFGDLTANLKIPALGFEDAGISNSELAVIDAPDTAVQVTTPRRRPLRWAVAAAVTAVVGGGSLIALTRSDNRAQDPTAPAAPDADGVPYLVPTSSVEGLTSVMMAMNPSDSSGYEAVRASNGAYLFILRSTDETPDGLSSLWGVETSMTNGVTAYLRERTNSPATTLQWHDSETSTAVWIDTFGKPDDITAAAGDLPPNADPSASVEAGTVSWLSATSTATVSMMLGVTSRPGPSVHRFVLIEGSDGIRAGYFLTRADSPESEVDRLGTVMDEIAGTTTITTETVKTRVNGRDALAQLARWSNLDAASPSNAENGEEPQHIQLAVLSVPFDDHFVLTTLVQSIDATATIDHAAIARDLAESLQPVSAADFSAAVMQEPAPPQRGVEFMQVDGASVLASGEGDGFRYQVSQEPEQTTEVTVEILTPDGGQWGAGASVDPSRTRSEHILMPHDADGATDAMWLSQLSAADAELIGNAQRSDDETVQVTVHDQTNRQTFEAVRVHVESTTADGSTAISTYLVGHLDSDMASAVGDPPYEPVTITVGDGAQAATITLP